jgi:hypothetical protein
MFFRVMISILTLGIGMGVGFTVSRSTLQSASAQEPTQILIRGSGRAISSLKPHDSEKFTLSGPDTSRIAFTVVPAGKKFVLTDVMYIAQGSVRQDLVVNIADASPSTQNSKGPRSEFGHSILFQVTLSPRQSDQVHLCSGYIIPAGSSLIAFTNAGLEPEQYVSVSVTGYLTNE